MTNLLARLFIKDYKNTDNYKVREQYGKLAGIAGITTNLLLFVMKITVGAIFNSNAIIADSINTYLRKGFEENKNQRKRENHSNTENEWKQSR